MRGSPAASPGRRRPCSRRSGAPGWGDVSCASGGMAPAGSPECPGPRLLARPGPFPGGSAAAGPGPARPLVLPPRPRPRRLPGLPDPRQAPYPRGAGPRGALPRMSVRAGSAPRAQGPEHRAGASPLSRLLFLSPSLCSLVGLLLLASLPAPAHHTARLTRPDSHSAAAAAAAAAAARIYRMSRPRKLAAPCPASSVQPIRTAGCLKGLCRVRSVCVGPAGRRQQPLS